MIIKPLLVILTIPHAECVENRICDKTAEENARKLSKTFTKQKITNIMIIGEINRELIDLNREESLGTPFFDELKSLINTYGDKNHLLLLDIHSGDFGNFRFVILKLKEFKELDLINNIQNNTNAVIMLGSKENFITQTATDLNIPALLLEFNDRIKYDKSFFEEIVDGVINWYLKISKGMETIYFNDKKQIKSNRFMKIRILEPDIELWYPIIKRRNRYYITSEKSDLKNRKKQQRFITFDAVESPKDWGKAGIQGIAFIRGVPKEDHDLENGYQLPRIDSENIWKSQAIRIEYKSIRSNVNEILETQIEKALKRYKNIIIEFLSKEYKNKKIKDIIIKPKEPEDFYLEIIY
jgi:hypothetical protein